MSHSSSIRLSASLSLEASLRKSSLSFSWMSKTTPSSDFMIRMDLMLLTMRGLMTSLSMRMTEYVPPDSPRILPLSLRVTIPSMEVRMDFCLRLVV